MVELGTWTAEGDEDENDIEDTIGYEKQGAWHAILGSEVHMLVFLPSGFGVISALSGLQSWLAQQLFWSCSFWWWYPQSSLISLFLILTAAIT
jgi:hypothetical protein